MFRCFICYNKLNKYYILLPEKDDIYNINDIDIDSKTMEIMKCCNIYFLYYRLCEICSDNYLFYIHKIKNINIYYR